MKLKAFPFKSCPVALQGTVFADDLESSVFHIGVGLRGVDEVAPIVLCFQNMQPETDGWSCNCICSHEMFDLRQAFC
jgi:hypothetical protein